MTEYLTPEVSEHRKAEYDVDSFFLNRWSPRSFLDKEVPDALLFSVFEAARWAPSSSNEQPWRYIIARTQEDRSRFYSFILLGNLEWCTKAPVLAVIISNKLGKKGNANLTHAFDAGTSWGYLALEASRKGLITHAMAGFDPDKAREALQVPQEYDMHAVIALGYRGPKETLPDNQQEREFPSTRRPFADSLFEGCFDKKFEM